MLSYFFPENFTHWKFIYDYSWQFLHCKSLCLRGTVYRLTSKFVTFSRKHEIFCISLCVTLCKCGGMYWDMPLTEKSVKLFREKVCEKQGRMFTLISVKICTVHERNGVRRCTSMCVCGGGGCTNYFREKKLVKTKESIHINFWKKSAYERNGVRRCMCVEGVYRGTSHWLMTRDELGWWGNNNGEGLIARRGIRL
jgi:hypothetical protein